jgi:hypothetical protein
MGIVIEESALKLLNGHSFARLTDQFKSNRSMSGNLNNYDPPETIKNALVSLLNDDLSNTVLFDALAWKVLARAP